MQPGSDATQTTETEGSFYRASETTQKSDPAQSAGKEAFSWEASEYVDHEKSFGWYAVLAGVATVVAALVFIITQGDLMTTIVIVIAAVLFGVVASRRPRTLEYIVDNHGVSIGGKLYAYADIKTFSLITETAVHSVQLLPLKRFMPPISVYFPPEQEDKIVQMLGNYLPYEQGGRDAFDRLMSRIRF